MTHALHITVSTVHASTVLEINKKSGVSEAAPVLRVYLVTSERSSVPFLVQCKRVFHVRIGQIELLCDSCTRCSRCALAERTLPVPCYLVSSLYARPILCLRVYCDLFESAKGLICNKSGFRFSGLEKGEGVCSWT